MMRSGRIAVSACLAFASLAVSAAQGRTTGVVFTQGSAYLPGDQRDVVPVPLVHVAGGELLYTNLDPFIGHSVTSLAFKPGSFTDRLFDSGVISFRQQGPVVGVAALAPGRYDFTCQIHPDMVGALDVV